MTYGVGRIISHGSPLHRCNPPNSWWKRRKLKVRENTVWECGCGKRWCFYWMDTDLATFGMWKEIGR